jgi:hypothetical protein
VNESRQLQVRPIRALRAVLLSVVACLGTALPASAEAPPFIPVQGFITDLAGAPAAGPLSIHFRLYDAASGGATVHQERFAEVPVQAGTFTVYLGDQVPLPLEIFRDHTLLWLGMQVGDDEELTPRVQLGAAPFAAFAQYCGDATTLGGYTADQLLGKDGEPGAPGLVSVTATPPLTAALENQTLALGLDANCPTGRAIQTIGAGGTTCIEVADSKSVEQRYGRILTATFNNTGQNASITMLSLPDFDARAVFTTASQTIDFAIARKGSNRKSISLVGGADLGTRVSSLNATTSVESKDVGDYGTVDADVVVLETDQYFRFHCFRAAVNVLTCDYTVRGLYP